MAQKTKKLPNIRSTEAVKLVQKNILALRRDGKSFAEIAEALRYKDVASVRKLYKMALRDIIIEEVEDIRKIELERLDNMYAKAVEVMNGVHLLIKSGKVVRVPLLDADGEPVRSIEGEIIKIRIEDVSPKLAAIDRAVKLMERRARLLGLDSPMLVKEVPSDETNVAEAMRLIAEKFPT